MNLHWIKQADLDIFVSNGLQILRISMAWGEDVELGMTFQFLFFLLYPPKFLAISFLLSGMFPSTGVNIAETWVRNDKWFFCWNILQTRLPSQLDISKVFDSANNLISFLLFDLSSLTKVPILYQSIVGKWERNQLNDWMTILWNQRKRQNLKLIVSLFYGNVPTGRGVGGISVRCS